MTPKRPGVA
jgi:hypothetical protein